MLEKFVNIFVQGKSKSLKIKLMIKRLEFSFVLNREINTRSQLGFLRTVLMKSEY